MRRIRICILTALLPFLSLAKVYKLDGMIGSKYPVVIELEEFEEGWFSGQYAYTSTLRKSGDNVCSWLLINPSYEAPETQWAIRDCKPDVVETWSNVKFDGKHLTARMKNVKGTTYDVVATVTQQANESAPLTSFFKQHIGEMVCDFDMFNYLPIKFRLLNMMENSSYAALKEIYQTQGDIEYSKGMFYGSGFMAHQCCDPATVWAYDTDNNSFYVWIRKDGKDYWWSETGNIPIKFREIVRERF
ncbi:MAG: hypothetical protein HDR82_09350 [Bacteroides sp.]|nr:hypothetical protein [Bacteroides sp.]